MPGIYHAVNTAPYLNCTDLQKKLKYAIKSGTRFLKFREELALQSVKCKGKD
jgi:hypothetical protein